MANLYDDDGYLIIYIDGCCLGNNKKDAPRKAGIGVWFNHYHSKNFFGPVKGTATNNNAEIQAATKAISLADDMSCRYLRIWTDSTFLINCMNAGWLENWKRNHWRTAENEPVRNRESLEELDSIISLVGAIVDWQYVPAHQGYVGNDEADALAKRGAQQYCG